MKHQDKNWLHKQYFELGKTQKQIADENDLKQCTISKWLLRHFSKDELKKNWKYEKRETFKGSNHHFWKGGITPINVKIRTSVEAILWRKSVYERDKYTCQKCAKVGNKLRAHHINNFADFPELRFAIDNGITLCNNCHKGFHKIYGNKSNIIEQLYEYIQN
jgi:hypothetical protein